MKTLAQLLPVPATNLDTSRDFAGTNVRLLHDNGRHTVARTRDNLATMTANPRAMAEEILCNDPSDGLAQAEASVVGRLVQVVGPDGTVGYARAPLPAALVDVLNEARLRRAAVAELLRPYDPVDRQTWLLGLAAATEKAPEAGPAGDALIALAVGLLDLPSVCFTPATMLAVGRATKGFWPQPLKLRVLLEPFADELRREERNLAAIIEGLIAEGRRRKAAEEEARRRPDPATIIAQDLDRYEARAKEDPELVRTQCGAYLARLRRLAPDLADRFSGRFLALIHGPVLDLEVDPPEAADHAPASARTPPHKPVRDAFDMTAWRENDPLVKAARSGQAIVLPPPEELAARVDLGDRDPSHGPPETVRRDAETPETAPI